MLRANRSSYRSTRQISGGCGVLFGLLFIFAGIAVGVFLYFPSIASCWSARGWEEVPCWIETAELKTTHNSKGGMSYHVDAGYRYEFDRHRYHGDQVSFFGGSDNMGDFQEHAFQQIQAFEGKDRSFHCFVNPAKPEEAVLFRDLRWGLLLTLSIFPTLFPLAGFLISIGSWVQSRREAQIKRLTAQHPGEPWRWRHEWAGDAIQASKDGLPLILGVAGWILVVQLPLALAVIFGGEVAKSTLALLALLPAVLALIPLWFVWQQMRSRRVFGKPRLQIKQLPLSPGRALAGVLQFDHELSPLSTISVRVLCQRQITRSRGNSRSTAKETIWEHTETLSAAEARREVSGVSLPLHVDIPRGLPCATVDDASLFATDGEQHVWTLEVRSSQGGKGAVLPLPVFARNDAADEVESAMHEPEVAMALSTDDLVTRLQADGVRAAFDAKGIPTLIECPAGRFRGMSIFLLLFGAFWSAAFVFMVWQGAPLIFRLVWGITSPLILGGGLWTLLYSRRVEVVAGELRILNRIGPLYSWGEIFEAHHITGFTHDTNMQTGNQFYYRVRADTIFDKQKTLIDGITESVTAEMLAGRLEEWRKHR
jgi:hypothetical protein